MPGTEQPEPISMGMRLARQAKTPENTVHDEGDTGHVADVLQDCQEEEQHEHLRHKAQHRAHAADDALGDQVLQPLGNAGAFQPAFHRHRHPAPRAKGGRFRLFSGGSLLVHGQGHAFRPPGVPSSASS